MTIDIQRTSGWERARTAVPFVGLLLLAAAPLLGASSFMMVVLTSVLAYGLLAMSVNLLSGFTGLPTLAHAGYFGVGAYASALAANHLSANALLQFGCAIAAAAVAAALSGWMAVRTAGTMFLMVSLAIGELLQILASKWRSVTNGSDGLAASTSFEMIPGHPVFLTGLVYWYVFAVFLVLAGSLTLLCRSPFGWALRGICDNESRMRAIGYPTSIYKYVVFVISGAFAGGAGWISVAQLPRFVSPERLSFLTAGLVLLAVVIGGVRSLTGSFVAASLIVIVNDVLSPSLGGHGPLVLGLVFIAAVYALPSGLAGLRLNDARRMLGLKQRGAW